MTPSRRLHLDLFSGLGGFALAARWTGWTTVAFSETDPYANRILKKHWPDVANLGDITHCADWPFIECDLITGGFPCQPHSLAGKRRGAADDRALWPFMRAVIARSRPAWVVAENVPGIRTVEQPGLSFDLGAIEGAFQAQLQNRSRFWPTIEAWSDLQLHLVAEDLQTLGYAVHPLVVPACGVDARHRRDRVWVVAHAHHERRNAATLDRKPASHDCGQAQPENQAEQPGGSPVLADASRLQSGWPEQWTERQRAGQCREQSALSDAGRSLLEKSQGEQPFQPEAPASWLPEPDVGRVADGIPHRVDRLRCLGNAIVPKVAAVLLGSIAEIETARE